MGLVKCPRCELNYMNEGEKMCSICRREIRGESEQYDVIELCSECGENPVVPGQELCAYCLKELARRSASSSEETPIRESANIGIDSVSTMDEIELDIGGDMDDEVFEGEEEAFDDEDKDEEDKDKDKDDEDKDEDDEEDED